VLDGLLQCVLYPPRENQYITVLRKNRIFAVPVYPPNSTTPYGTAEITKYGRGSAPFVIAAES